MKELFTDNNSKQESVTAADVAIIGAGVCGLYAALTLARFGKKVVVIEKEERVGGLAAGFKFGENYCDFGVHMLHAFNKEIFEDCASLMAEERIEVALDARIKWGETTCKYPLKFSDMLGVMPVGTLFRCVAGLLIAELSGAKRRKNIENAEDALIAFYGPPLYEFFFEEFTHRYWGIHPRELSAEFIRRKMPRLSAVDFVRKLMPSFSRKGKSKEGLVESALDTETLHYSKTGAETLPRVLAREVEKLGGRIELNQKVESIKEIGDVFDKGYKVETGDFEIKVKQVINTAPLPLFLGMLDDVPEAVKLAVAKLSYKPTVISALLVKKEQCMEGLYTYYRIRVFHRVGAPKNAGLVVKPKGHSLLIVESTCSLGDERWNSGSSYRGKVVLDLEEEGIVEKGEIVDWMHLRNAYGYPIYNLGFEKALKQVMNWIAVTDGLHTAGRQGAFTYPAMHTAMQMGKSAAHAVLGPVELGVADTRVY